MGLRGSGRGWEDCMCVREIGKGATGTSVVAYVRVQNRTLSPAKVRYLALGVSALNLGPVWLPSLGTCHCFMLKPICFIPLVYIAPQKIAYWSTVGL